MMTNILQTLSGYKTYLLCGAGILVVLVNHFIGQIPGTPPETDPNDWLTQIWQILLLASGRSAAAKIEEKVATK